MKGYYINLDSRKDRKEHFEKNIKKYPFFSNIKRFNAVYHKAYGVGCILSHIGCIKELLKEDDDYYLIMEDDFCILNEDNLNEFFFEFDKIKDNNEWDMITLTPRGKTVKKNKINNFNQICDCQTATGYIIKKEILPILMDVFKKGALGLMKGYRGPPPNPYFNDQCWKPLQEKTTWLYFNKIYGGQLPGYSNIEERIVDYNKVFLMQK